MNHFIAGILKIAILEASCALLILDRLLGGSKAGPYPKQRRWAFGVVAALAAFSFCNFGTLHGDQRIVHSWEQFHFYLGAKYQKEVGWFDLYKAVLLADRESARILGGITETRDIHTFELVPVSQAMLEAPRVRAQFSDARWAEFKDDWTRMAQVPADWANVLKDHGNSNSPAWSVLAHPIAALLPLNHESQVAIAWLDFALMAVLWWFVFKTFDIRVASVGLVIASTAPLVFDYLAGSFLRWDWVFATGMCLCFLQRKKYGVAGAFFGYAVATKLFPIFFGMTLLIRAALEVVQDRNIPARYLRFGAASVGSLAFWVLAAALMFGSPRVWLEYKERIDVARVEKFYGIQYSLKTVFLQVVESTPAELFNAPFAPRSIQQAQPRVNIEDHALAFLAVQLLFTLLIALAVVRADDVSAFTLGPFLVFTWLTVNMYYWSMLGFAAMGFALRKERPALAGLLGLHGIFASLYLYQHTNHGYAEGYFVALLISLGLLGLAAAEGLTLYRAGWRPWVVKARPSAGPAV